MGCGEGFELRSLGGFSRDHRGFGSRGVGQGSQSSWAFWLSGDKAGPVEALWEPRPGPSTNGYPGSLGWRIAMAKGVFARTKPHVNVGTIGHIDHGKSTLTAAMSARSAKRFGGTVKSYAEVTKGGTVRDASKTVTIAASHTEYETPKRHYAH